MIHEITSTTPRNKRTQRKGRGESSGRGKTSGRGNKAAHGGDVAWKPGHEGGQTPLFRRLPKRGFSNFNFENRYQIVNLSDLNSFDNGATVDAAALKEAGILSDTKLPVKILADGELKKKLTVVAGWYSKSAHEKITKAGGTAQNLKGEAFAFPKPKKKFVPRAKDAAKKKKQAEEAPVEAAAPAPAAEAPKAE
jgi:large subunit ribosomal protein L15